MFEFNLLRHTKNIEFINTFAESGRVKKILGPIVEGTLPGASVGGIVRILSRNMEPIDAEIVGFKDRTALMMPLGNVDGISMGARIEQLEEVASVNVGPWMIGQLLNGHGKIAHQAGNGADGSSESSDTEKRKIKTLALSPLERASIKQRFETRVRAIDASLPLGHGQRIAVMAGSGVGKSMLMGMIARQSQADINVIALIGERGREVTEFLERDLGPEGLKKSIVIAVTGDESPVLRVRGAYVATTIAEYFRDQGKNCLLIMDSVTRFAMALREIGLAAGEPPTTKGYTPSVFNHMPRLLERAGAKRGGGSITGVYTVLVEGDDFDDPIADNVRSIVDGHIVLTRDLATKNHYPAVSILDSVSRLSTVVSDEREQALNSEIRKTLAIYRQAEDLINIGGYRKGTNPQWDKAIELYPKIIQFLQQKPMEANSLIDTRAQLEEIFRAQ